MLHVCADTGTGIKDWLHQGRTPTTTSPSRPAVSVRRVGGPDGDLLGETIVFTGKLSIVRREAADIAAQAGCSVVGNVSKEVTMLVVGTQNKSQLDGYEKSSKHRKAEALINRGADIQILSEQDFFELIRY